MRRIFLLFLVCLTAQSIAQELPFYEDIKAFQKQDSISFPPKKSILFVGSSSIRFWEKLQEDFRGYKVINRGFGGSSLQDVIRYTDKIIIPYRPKQIIIYCGENDLANSDTVSSRNVADRFAELFRLIRKGLPKVPIAFVSIKPSPSREHLKMKIIRANELIKEFLGKQKKATYINVYDQMVDANGNPRKELFIEDMLHMNADGYAIWKRIIQPYLKR